MKQANGSPERQLATVVVAGLTVLYVTGWVSHYDDRRTRRLTFSVGQLDRRDETRASITTGIILGDNLLPPRIVNLADTTNLIIADPVLPRESPTVSTGLCGELQPG